MRSDTASLHEAVPGRSHGVSGSTRERDTRARTGHEGDRVAKEGPAVSLENSDVVADQGYWQVQQDVRVVRELGPHEISPASNLGIRQRVVMRRLLHVALADLLTSRLQMPPGWRCKHQDIRRISFI